MAELHFVKEDVNQALLLLGLQQPAPPFCGDEKLLIAHVSKIVEKFAQPRGIRSQTCKIEVARRRQTPYQVLIGSCLAAHEDGRRAGKPDSESAPRTLFQDFACLNKWIG